MSSPPILTDPPYTQFETTLLRGDRQQIVSMLFSLEPKVAFMAQFTTFLVKQDKKNEFGESRRGWVERIVGIRGVKDTTNKPTESINLGLTDTELKTREPAWN